jgi:hypothetical protein
VTGWAAADDGKASRQDLLTPQPRVHPQPPDHHERIARVYLALEFTLRTPEFAQTPGIRGHAGDLEFLVDD